MIIRVVIHLYHRYSAAKEAGVMRSEGKEYVVQEVSFWCFLQTLTLSTMCTKLTNTFSCQGDVLLFRFNV